VSNALRRIRFRIFRGYAGAYIAPARQVRYSATGPRFGNNTRALLTQMQNGPPIRSGSRSEAQTER
jgi:hypothetical protein